ncbi:prostaglandin F2 receptor negative regulator [Chanos chanos]|uniref:Prostaglandin F2 receptor negative regulator n=1 Tax=Chanos chanos TaxID=29144 RepID=A0A6J2WFK0_CHACN|nr:prostaglandin F2 receptor negative regulator [Chanos chanos]
METQKWHFTIFVLSLTLALCEGRVVKVVPGPLVRVEGQAVSIRCDVSNYEGPRDQDFEWLLVPREGNPIQLVSTFDSTYPDRSVLDRVRSGDIAVNKLGDAAAELKIQKVRATDTGTYRCVTPSTDSVASGNYEADVELKVIGDSLKVEPVPPKPVVSEGEPLQLQCNATRAFTEHTFLSVTWSIQKKSGPLQEILTFGPDDGLTVGNSSRQRYGDGGLRLNLGEPGSYSLILTGAQPTDQGEYVCTVREWVRQAGGGKGWQKILERSEKMGSVTITPIAQSLAVAVEKKTTVNVEDTLKLTCSVAAANLESLSLEVTWLVRAANSSAAPRVLLHMGRDGQTQNGSALVGLSRVGLGDFRLVVHKVERSDSGLYSCQVKIWLPQGSGSWYQAAEKTSQPVQVTVMQLEPQFKVTVSKHLTPQVEGDPTELICRVSDLLHLQDGRLGVTWTFTKNVPGDVSPSPLTVGSLNEHGSLVPGKEYQQRLESGDIAILRSEEQVFRLRMIHTRKEDMGHYTCVVSAWGRTRQGGWARTKEVQSSPTNVFWTPKTPVLSVVAHRVREASTGGSTFEMSCHVTAQNLQNPGYSVLIRFAETQGGHARKVLSLSPDSVLQLEEWTEPSRIDSVVLEKTGQLEYRFRLYGVQVSDRGLYYCDVTAWTRHQNDDWARVVSAESNKINIAFEDTGPVFNVSIHSDRHSVLPGETAKMECILTVQGSTPNTGDVAYEVRWFQSPARAVENGGSEPLISIDRWGVVRKSGGNDSTDCSLERADGNSFVLRVHHAGDGDAGQYYCTATPWLFSPSTGAWTKGHDLTSTTVFLSIKLALWDSVKMPVLYGVVAAVLIGLLSLLLGFISARCCFSRNLMHTPRSHNKLMDLEMD